ncbi:O-antigen ligase family protein [Marinobacter sp. F3R08]|uniref:O-antigen ligase family protein n=1 Tax=Marinobacter sp. F3R08 TaxID=2841559 RepID=UPI001E5C39A2|nr:O-antigen ligase family protein [Marinobacter sp. F3R08]
MAPETPEERIIWYGLGWTYGFYVLGALYLVGPVIGWLLFLLVFSRLLDPGQEFRVPGPVTLWLLGMLLMLVCIVVGHLLQGLGTGQLIKSSIGWAKGWALMALFILAGSTLNIRAELIARAAMRVCLHTLVLLPVFVGAWLLRLPETAYVSPLKAIGGPGPEFFAVSLYELDPQSQLPRWRLFTPWAPALGFVANIFFLLAFVEQDTRWRRIGICASVLMILMSQSRLAILVLLAVVGLLFTLRYLRGPVMAFTVMAASLVFAFAGSWFLESAENAYESIKSARADSTRVREALARIALHRWQTEAPVWGHGVVERGPHLVEYMPIGSHHSWYGLLFVKGLVGFAALAIPLAASLLFLGLKLARGGITERTGFVCALLLLLYTFGENLEILAYLIWPGLMFIGLAHKHEPRPAQPLTLGPPA